MTNSIETILFEDDDVNTIEDFRQRIIENKKDLFSTGNIVSVIQQPQPTRYEWVFQFGDDEPVSFFTTHQDMLNPNGTLTITCSPSNATSVEFRQEDKTFKIYSRTLD